MQNTAPIPKSLCHSAVSLALAEDLGRAGDITSLSVIPENAPAIASIVSRESGVLAGLDLQGQSGPHTERTVVLAAWTTLKGVEFDFKLRTKCKGQMYN